MSTAKQAFQRVQAGPRNALLGSYWRITARSRQGWLAQNPEALTMRSQGACAATMMTPSYWCFR